MQQIQSETQTHPQRWRKIFWLVLLVIVGAWAGVGVRVDGDQTAHAKSWCANPLWVHEWGVHVLNGAGERVTMPVHWPKFFHGAAGSGGVPVVTPVRHLPPDNGIRALPVLHFYAPAHHSAIPLALEVGFTEGRATLWYPQVDTLRTATDAHSAWAKTQREALQKARADRKPFDPSTMSTGLDPDPTRQLGWEALSLDPTPARAAQEDPLAAWLGPLRAMDRALWVNGAAESERFLFYEGATAEKPLIKVERGPSWTATRPHYVLRNTSSVAVHDVFVIQRDPAKAADVRVFYAPSIPAGAYAGFLLDGPPLNAADFTKQTRDMLLASLVDSKEPSPPERYDWGTDTCVMGRDPALPQETAEGHKLYQAEADVILEMWGARFFEQPGTVIVYREDIAYVDAQMPISIFTDMLHFVKLRRASLVVWEGLDLAAMSAP